MSHMPQPHMPPAYGKVTPSNPDVRPLPQGWVQQYDEKYQTWFYVNTCVSPPVTQWTHPSGHEAPTPPGSPPPQYTPPPGPPNHDPYPNEKKSSGRPYNNSSPHDHQGEYENYDSYPHLQGGGYGDPHDGGHGGPSRGKAQKATLIGLLGSLAEAKVNRHVQAHKAHWEYKRAKVGLLAGGASLVGGALTGRSSSSREEHGHHDGYGGAHEEGHRGPLRGRNARNPTVGGLLGGLAEAKVNRHAQVHQARWEYKKAKVGFLAGGVGLIGDAVTGRSSSSREAHSHHEGNSGDNRHKY